MGSGLGSYSGTGGASQPFAPLYHVEKQMHQYDIDNGTFRNGQYYKNPTAKTLDSMINGNYVGNKSTNEENLPYVIDTTGNIIVGKRNGNGRGGAPTPHPTLIGGADPVVQIAGILKIRGGKIYSYDDRSGHFKPNAKSMSVADEIFGKLPMQLFHKNFTRRKNNE